MMWENKHWTSNTRATWQCMAKSENLTFNLIISIFRKHILENRQVHKDVTCIIIADDYNKFKLPTIRNSFSKLWPTNAVGSCLSKMKWMYIDWHINVLMFYCLPEKAGFIILCIWIYFCLKISKSNCENT